MSKVTLLAALEVLRNVEWSATEDHPEGGTYPCCPICEGGDPDRPGTPEGYEGHRDDCELDAVIQEIETVLMIAGDEQPQVPVVTRWDATIREAAQAAIESAADLLAERKHSESAPDALMAIRHEVAEWVEREMAKLAIPANNGELREIVWQSLMAAYGTGVSDGVKGVAPSEQVKAVDEMTDRLLARLAPPATPQGEGADEMERVFAARQGEGGGE